FARAPAVLATLSLHDALPILILPVNSSTERTSTSWPDLRPSRIAETSSLKARMEGSVAATRYLVGLMLGASLVSGRFSSSHFLRPPLIRLTSLWPYSFNCQKAYAANQLLLSP